MAPKPDRRKTTPAPEVEAARPEPQREEEELDRVRDIIMGPDRVRLSVRKAEADRLRDVIFGPQMEEYERRFTDLQREMERVLSDFRHVRESVSEF